MRSKVSLQLFCIILLALIVYPQPAYAYVDPGTGSYVLQIIVAGIAAASFSLKLFWGRIKLLFSKNPPAEESDDRNE